MSLFASANMWAESYKACGAPNQSPINLSQSFAKPCDLLCELAVPDVAIPTAIIKSDPFMGFVVGYEGSKPTITWNGDGYTAQASYLHHPSHHTIEDVQSQAEFITYFTSPSGGALALSVLVRAAPGTSSATSFFNSFVPYLTQQGTPITVNLGDSFMLSSVVPPNASYYTYTGSWILPNCDGNVTWVVFADTVNMDPNDFAILSSRSEAGSRPLQPVGDREVFYNDQDALLGSENAHLKQDGKVYMKCRRLPRSGEGPPMEKSAAVKEGGLAEAKAKSFQAKIEEWYDTNVSQTYNNALNTYGYMGFAIAGFALLLLYYFFFTESGGKFVVGVLYAIELPTYYLWRWPWEKLFGWLFAKPTQ
jgi:carbonic anhydrase